MFDDLKKWIASKIEQTRPAREAHFAKHDTVGKNVGYVVDEFIDQTAAAPSVLKNALRKGLQGAADSLADDVKPLPTPSMTEAQRAQVSAWQQRTSLRK